MYNFKFEWDENKNKRNKQKHDLSFETAQLVFNDPFALSYLDRDEDGEERWHTIGTINGIVIVIVAHTLHFENQTEIIRIISARKAVKKERKRYEKQSY